MKRKEKDKLTILVDKDIKESYKQHCDTHGLIMGKQIELFMENELKRKEERKNDKK